MGKKYNSVKDVINNLESDNAFKKRSLLNIEKHSLSKFLSLIRCKANLTQKQLAEKIKCSQSRISKIESLTDNLISVKDLTDYGDALDIRLIIGFENKNVTIISRIKHHIFRIRLLLDKLIKLAKGDAEIDKGVSKEFGEILINLLNMFEQSSRKLKNIKITKSVKKNIVIEEPDDFIRKNIDYSQRSTCVKE